MRTNTANSYGSVARVFHWLTALIILSAIGLGLLAKRGSFDGIDGQVLSYSLHKTLGIAALIVASLRILWALSQKHPAPVHPDRRAETFAAELAHWLLYVSMIIVPLAGWAEHAATEGFAPILWPFGQSLPFIPKSGHLAETLAAVHSTFAWVLIATIAAHVAGALKHLLIDRDGVLARMTKGHPAGAPVPAPGSVAAHLAPAALAVAIFAAGGAYALATRPETPAATPALETVASQWTVTEGTLTFGIRQLGSPVQGSFSDWTAAINFDEKTGTGDVTVTINLGSVSIGTVTDQAKGAAFFDVANHPTATFTARIRPEGDAFLAEGQLEMKGATVPLTLPFTLTITDGVAQMAGKVTMDRRDWAIGQGYDDEGSVAFPVELAVALTAKR